EDNLIYSASGRGFWRKVNNINYESMITELKQYVDADKVGLIIFGGGANDAKWYNPANISNSTHILIETAHQLYPNARIIIAQMGWSKYAEGELPDGYVPHGAWDDIIQKNVIPLSETLMNVCNDYDYACFAGNVGMDALKGHEDEYFTGKEGSGQVDLIHPNYLGNEALAELLCDRIKSTDISYLCEYYLTHNWSEWKNGPFASCSEDGYDFRECSRCQTAEKNVIPAFGHDYGEWTYDGIQNKTHSRVCMNDPSHIETQPCQFDQGIVSDKQFIYTCLVCGGQYAADIDYPVIQGITRLAGDNRYLTSQKISDEYLRNSNISKVNSVVLVSGNSFADALSGAYLAQITHSPILLTTPEKARETNKYIAGILNQEGRVYVLGGTSAVPEECLKGLQGYNVIRLSGNNRYETNLKILEYIVYLSERPFNEELLVATGEDFADSLCASALSRPLMLVKGDQLTDKQITFIKSYAANNIAAAFDILGGEKAVSLSLEQELGKYGTVDRIWGNSRLETSIRIAEKFFDRPIQAVVAYSDKYPDGLCGGVLSNQINAPLIITKEGKENYAAEYLESNKISNCYVLGGTAVLPDSLIKKLFVYKQNV
ncbi:MAG: cell wall-binding repeat-containing protein, partial [Erysipelotrichaceae bacterium]|nr:cell wall-binding repeat-containing protein [Erysipelotrichaceae bacterium]